LHEAAGYQKFEIDLVAHQLADLRPQVEFPLPTRHLMFAVFIVPGSFQIKKETRYQQNQENLDSEAYHVPETFLNFIRIGLAPELPHQSIDKEPNVRAQHVAR
jgi:hypothetical protein